MDDDDKRFCVCSSCLSVNYWTREEYYANKNCKCGCAIWAIDRDQKEAMKMARWSKRMCGI